MKPSIILLSDTKLINYLAYNAKDSEKFCVRTIKKRNGGRRTIIAPSGNYKKALHELYSLYKDEVLVSRYAHGFNPGSSIVTNALQHIGKGVVINLDITNFFPSVTFKQVKRVFRMIESDPWKVDAYTMLCTRKVNRKRYLFQGSPMSPLLSNGVCYKLDSRLAEFAASIGFTYTRYADDLTFSGDALHLTALVKCNCEKIVREHGFSINHHKTTVSRYFGRQTVTGLIVNS